MHIPHIRAYLFGALRLATPADNPHCLHEGG
eukprot:COSAG03_NODE_34241_length_127_cov_470.214286_1_plen_30_part_01